MPWGHSPFLSNGHTGLSLSYTVGVLTSVGCGWELPELPCDAGGWVCSAGGAVGVRGCFVALLSAKQQVQTKTTPVSGSIGASE